MPRHTKAAEFDQEDSDLSRTFDALILQVKSQGESAKRQMIELFYYTQEADLLALLRSVAAMNDEDKLVFQYLAFRLADLDGDVMDAARARPSAGKGRQRR